MKEFGNRCLYVNILENLLLQKIDLIYKLNGSVYIYTVPIFGAIIVGLSFLAMNLPGTITQVKMLISK